MKFFLLFSAMVISSQAAVVVKDDQIVFDRRDKDLPWPLPDVDDYGVLIYHGVHCFEKIQEELVNETNEIESMHHDHCQDVVVKILSLLQTDSSYKVNEWICKAMQGDATPKNHNFHYGHYDDKENKLAVQGKQNSMDENAANNKLPINHNFHYGHNENVADKEKLINENRLAVNHNFHYGHYDKAAIKENPTNNQAVKEKADNWFNLNYMKNSEDDKSKLPINHNFHYGHYNNVAEKEKLINENRAKYAKSSENNKLPVNHNFKYHTYAKAVQIETLTKEDQDIVSADLAGTNLGNLLMKNWADSKSMNKAEQEYVQKWTGETATAMGAIGVYCQVNGNLEKIQNSLKVQQKAITK